VNQKVKALHDSEGVAMGLAIDELRARLDEGYGFRTPRGLAPALAASQGIERNEFYSTFRFEWLYDDVRPWTRHRNIDPNYAGFVPEFFTIGSLGEDGVKYGYVVRAPELELQEYPVYEFVPEYASVFALAADVETTLLDKAAESAADSAERGFGWSQDAYAAVGSALGWPPLPPPPAAERGREPFVPRLLDGWRFVATEDRIGALARTEAFGGDDIDVARFLSTYCEYIPQFDEWHPRPRGAAARHNIDDYLLSLLRDCRTALKAGYAGSALVGIRRLFWAAERTGSLSPILRNAVFEAWGEIYDVLGRPLLADSVRRARDGG
jgi:hypothetical protein